MERIIIRCLQALFATLKFLGSATQVRLVKYQYFQYVLNFAKKVLAMCTSRKKRAVASFLR